MDEFVNPPAPAQTPEPPEPAPGKRFSRLGWAFAVMLGSANIVQYLLLSLGGRYVQQLLDSGWSVLFFSLLPLYVIALPLGWLILKRLPAKAPEEHSLSTGHFAMLFVMCFSLVYIGNLIGVALNMGIDAAMGAIYDSPIYDLLKTTDIRASIVCVVLAAPIMEELIFRKLLCDRIRVYGEGTAILVSGLLFGLFHANLYQFFYAFAIGSLFAYIYLRTGRVRYTMILHAGINFVGGVLPMLVLKNIDLDAISKLSTDDMAGLIAYAQAHTAEMFGLGIYIITVFAVFVLGIVFLLMRRKQAVLLPTEKQLPKEGRGRVIFGNTGMIVYILLSAALTVYEIIGV